MTEKQSVHVIRVYAADHPMLPSAQLVGSDEHGNPMVMDEERVQTLKLVKETTARLPNREEATR